jgi:starvation-inducible DNA-binding protein
MSGPHFHDYHRMMMDEQAAEVIATTDTIAERIRKLGSTTLRSIGDIARLQQVSDNDADFVKPEDMLAELEDDNAGIISRMRQTHSMCDEYRDVATGICWSRGSMRHRGRMKFLFATRRQQP